jgi:CBS domain-containing protein
MKVKEVMTTNPAACTPLNTLADAAGFMWQHDCGILPVVADGGKVVGLITDRDICMASLLNARQLAHIAVEEVISGKVVACRDEDDVKTALLNMQENKIRRLPVLNDDGRLDGMLSMNDIVLRAQESKDKRVSAVSYADIVKTYQEICRHPLPQTKAAGV